MALDDAMNSNAKPVEPPKELNCRANGAKAASATGEAASVDRTVKKAKTGITNGHAEEHLISNGGSAVVDEHDINYESDDPHREIMEQFKEPDAAAPEASLMHNVELEDIQEVGITVNIQSPGADVLTVQLSSMELVQEIHQLIMDREETCHRTCFSLQLDGTTLDNFAELKSIEKLKSGSIIKVVEEPYTMREARIHVRHVRDLLKNLDPSDAYNGIDCTSLSFLHTITQGDLLDKKKSRPDSIDCTPPDYVSPGVKECPLLPLHPHIKNAKGPQAIKVLTTSAWNPPPGPRKLHGDLLYLYVVTMEDKRFHITACTKGFFINLSTDEVFNPKTESPGYLCHSLIDLLSQISPAFRRAFQQIQKKRTSRHAFERVATPYQVYQWASPQLEHTVDAIRAEDAFSSKLGYEEHIPGQTRDWNEELQTTRELPRKTLQERLLRERAIFKVHGDFVTAATRGAMAVIDGNVLAINPGDDPKMQMFIWNNIFFSLGFDVRDHYKELGGDHAAFVAPRYDLHGVRVYNAIDLEGLYTLGTVVVDYRGFRITAQSIIPGILEREQEQSVVYGSIDFGKTVLSHPKYLELLHKAAEPLKILPHFVLNERDEKVELCSSVECKGIIGNDGRHYILDLLRTFPPDVNFLKLDEVKLKPELKALGFPIEHKHKLCCLRQELLDAFVHDKYLEFISTASEIIKRNKENLNSSKETESSEVEIPAATASDISSEIEDDEEASKAAIQKALDEQQIKTVEGIEKCLKSNEANIDSEEVKQTIEAVRTACTAVGSVKEREFDIRFNPDLFSAGIRHVEEPDTRTPLANQKQLVQEAAEFLVLKQIPAFIKDNSGHSTPPLDGGSLTESLHNHGINIRYLGKVAAKLAEEERLEYLHRIAIMEMITRAAKHIYKAYMQNTDPLNLAAAISHFLNCLLSTGPINPVLANDEMTKYNKRGGKNKSKNAKNNKSLQLGGNTNNDWINVSPKTLWQSIKKEVKSYWDFELECDSIETAIAKYGFLRISLLRAFCLKVGIQILLREYNFEARNKPTFSEEDIVNVFPIVKHISPRATDAYRVYTHGQTRIHNGLIREGYEFISEALNLLNNVFGAMHTENGSCLRMLARLSYLLGDALDALSIQQRAVIMSERVNGIDHPCTILEYTHLALYSFANGQVSMSLKLLYRARYLTVLITGEDHPEIALIDSNISLILHAVGEFDLSLRFIENALRLNLKYFGRTLHAAFSYHLVARTHAANGDYRTALSQEKETYTIYKTLLGPNHEKTKESSECLKTLTSQAVLMQKRMNELRLTKKFNSNLSQPQAPPATMGTVLDMLNNINEIFPKFVFSHKDIARVRSELERHISAKKDTASDYAKEYNELISSAGEEEIKQESENGTTITNTNETNGKSGQQTTTIATEAKTITTVTKNSQDTALTNSNGE